MSLHFFAVPALQPEPAQSELNSFLAQGRVVNVQRHLVADGAASFWAVCVERLEGPAPLPEGLKDAGRRVVRSGQVDYREVLSPADFAVFVALRDWRKQAALQEAVPVYSVFSNEQLAEVARRRVQSAAQLAAIDGVGPGRVARYGAAVLQCVAGGWGDAGRPPAADLATGDRGIAP
jgi:superfamily II DNA helicase RecQ